MWLYSTREQRCLSDSRSGLYLRRLSGHRRSKRRAATSLLASYLGHVIALGLLTGRFRSDYVRSPRGLRRNAEKQRFAVSYACLSDLYPLLPSALTSGTLTRCSLRTHVCNSLLRNTWLTTRSLVPSSPTREARGARTRQSRIMIWCASSNRDSCTGTPSRPRGGRAMRVVSATSAAMARLTPPNN